MLNNKLLLLKSTILFLSIIGLLVYFSVIIKINKNVPYHVIEYDINELNYSELPYAGYMASLEDNYPTDDQGVMVFIYEGNEYYHPVLISQEILRFLGSYAQTNNQEYLKRAQLFARKLIEISFESKGAIYFPYNFDWPLHGGEEKMVAPWYSGMAQGQALSAFVRLYKVTGEREYLEAAEKTFRSFTYLKGENVPWVVYVDEAGYLWIEEYPMETPTHVLNGFIFGIYGLYDYYLLTNDPLSKHLLQASITTIHQYISEFRNEDDISFYCLKHKVKSINYHRIHIDQLTMLYRITEDDFFRRMSDNFYQIHDWQVPLTYAKEEVAPSILTDADHYVGHLVDLPHWTQGYDHYHLKIRLDSTPIEPPQKKYGVRVFVNEELIKEYPISNEVIRGWERIPLDKRVIEDQKKLYVSLQVFGNPDVFENYLAVFVLKDLYYGISVFNGSTQYLSIDRDERNTGTFLIGLEMKGKASHKNVDLWLGSHLSQVDKLSLLGYESGMWYSLGEKIRLIGHEVDGMTRAGETLRPRLYWQAQAPMDKDYTVFVHLLDENGGLRAQQDCQPQRGDYPTSLWRQGEVIWDSHEITLPTDLPAGTYRLVAGMYLPESVERLRVSDRTGRRLPDDVIPLDEIQVVGF